MSNHLSVAISPEFAELTRHVTEAAIHDDVPARLVKKDATLWGPAAQEEASIRLGWLDLPASSQALVPHIEQLREQIHNDGLDRIVLLGMGGSSLAPEVICRTAGVPLVVVDCTDAGEVRAALQDLDRTLVVVSSKSGGTVETDSQRRAFAQAFTDLGLSTKEVGQHFVAVTDPGSPLEKIAIEQGFREVIHADATVGGRYSALSAFGLVPSGLAGVDIAALLEESRELAHTLSTPDNAALELGAVLAAAYQQGRNKIIIAESGSSIVGFGDWAEQLIAESTGKEGKGLLPVVVESPAAPDTTASDAVLVTIGNAIPGASASVRGPLGAQFLAWEYAVAFAGRFIAINPFDQPNVAESKENTKNMLAAGLPKTDPARVFGPVEVYADDEFLAGAADLAGVFHAALDKAVGHSYLAVMAYLDRHADAAAAALRLSLAKALAQAGNPRPVTFGWAPRFLHSTGQYHKGGPQNGVFIQLTGAVTDDLAVPNQPYTFSQLQAAQAAGDLVALADRGRPVIRLHLTDRAAGLAALMEALS